MTNRDIIRVCALLRDSEETGDHLTAALCERALGTPIDRLNGDQYGALLRLGRRVRLCPSDAFRRLSSKLKAY